MDFDKYLALGNKLTVSVWLSDDDDEAQLFESYIKDVQPQARRILIDPPPLVREDLHTGMVLDLIIGLTVLSAFGKVICYPVIDEVEHGDLKGFWLRVPEEVEHNVEQRREYVRVTYPQTIQVQPIDRVTGNPLRPLECHGHDLSGGGVRFAAPRPFQPGSDVIVHLVLSDGSLPARANIVTAFENENPRASKFERYVATACFRNMEPHDETRVINECFRLELERQAREKGL